MYRLDTTYVEDIHTSKPPHITYGPTHLPETVSSEDGKHVLEAAYLPVNARKASYMCFIRNDEKRLFVVRSHVAEAAEVDRAGRVLAYLANNGPATKYKIEVDLRKLGQPIDHATLYKIVTTLKDSCSIEVVKTEKSRVGLPMEYYDLTTTGLIGAIQHDTKQAEGKEWTVKVVDALMKERPDPPHEAYGLDIDKLADKYAKCLPLVFGKWRLFKESGWTPEERVRFSSLRAFDWADWIGKFTYRREERIGLDAHPLMRNFSPATIIDFMTPAQFIEGNWFTRSQERSEYAKRFDSKQEWWSTIVAGVFHFDFFSIFPVFPSQEERDHYVAKVTNETLREWGVDATQALEYTYECKIWGRDPEIRDYVSTCINDALDRQQQQMEIWQSRKKRLEAVKQT